MADKCGWLEFKTAGQGGDERLKFDPSLSQCGDITNGVAFSQGRGWWVLSFEDLERAYKAAFAVRAAETE